MALKKTTPDTLAPIPVNAGIERAFARELRGIIKDMRADINTELIAVFKPVAKQEKIALDADITSWVNDILKRLGVKWRKRIEQLAPIIADMYQKRQVKNFDTLMMAQLRKAGFTVRFSLSDFQRDRLQAAISENVRMITSLSNRYLETIEVHVWNCIKSGYDLSALSKGLQSAYGISQRRADNIARDQFSKAHSVIRNARYEELGIEEAIWKHSHAGKTPRPEHVAADGVVYNVKQGLFLDGKWTHPGEEINCRCMSVPIIKGFS